jgi:hypothetical protein
VAAPHFYQFEADKPNGRWDRCRVWADRTAQDKNEPGDLYGLDEPVWLNTTSLLQPQNHVYWINAFRYVQGECWVHLTWLPAKPESALASIIPVRPWHLLKLPDMVRIAAESSRPIT